MKLISNNENYCDNDKTLINFSDFDFEQKKLIKKEILRKMK